MHFFAPARWFARLRWSRRRGEDRSSSITAGSMHTSTMQQRWCSCHFNRAPWYAVKIFMPRKFFNPWRDHCIKKLLTLYFFNCISKKNNEADIYVQWILKEKKMKIHSKKFKFSYCGLKKEIELSVSLPLPPVAQMEETEKSHWLKKKEEGKRMIKLWR